MEHSVCGHVASIQVGKPHVYQGDIFKAVDSRTWTSAIVKHAIAGPVNVSRLNLARDEQADLKHHGGVDKAVLAYSAEHYPKWNVEYPELSWQPGAFGENLTIAGANESDCCIGDVIQIGECRLEVTQPRQPCWKLSRRWDIPRFAWDVQSKGRTGWYLRVLVEGYIEASQPMLLLARPYPQFTINWASQLMYNKPHEPHQDIAFADCPALSASWRGTLQRRALQGEMPNDRRRLEGDCDAST